MKNFSENEIKLVQARLNHNLKNVILVSIFIRR